MALVINDVCECGELISIEVNSKCSARRDNIRPFYSDSDKAESCTQMRCRQCGRWIANSVPSAAYQD